MLERGTRAWVVLTILATLLIPNVGSIAAGNQELERKKERREQLQDEIDRREAEAGSLEDEARAINKNMIVLRAEIAKLHAEIAKIESQVRTAQARIDDLQEEIDKIERIATRQAVALYKSGATETLDALLNAESLTELDNRVEMLGVAAQENTGELVQFGRLQVEIEAAHQDLYNKKKALEGVRDEQGKYYASLNEQHQKLAAKIAAIEAQLGESYALENTLDRDINAMEQKILERTTLHSVAVLGKSSQGYIWPLNGNITSYYGPRWGRMHTGIDIDGSTGQPVVASNSGTVIMASSYSGYGNAVIIDHGGIQTLYAHLSSFNVSDGQQVAQGEIVGNVGCTGSCTGDHLHFEVRVNGSPVDPLDYLP